MQLRSLMRMVTASSSIIIPKQAAWLGGMVDLVEKENEGLKLDAAQIAALEKEFMDTFETFTVILSLSKK